MSFISFQQIYFSCRQVRECDFFLKTQINGVLRLMTALNKNARVADKENSIQLEDQWGVSFTFQSLLVVPGIKRGLLTPFFTQNQESLSATWRKKEENNTWVQGYRV